MTVSTMRRLCWSPSGLPECGYEVYCNVLGPVKAANKDAAGHGFHRKALQQAGLWDYDTVEEPSEDQIDADDDDEDGDSSAADGDGAFASGFQGRKKKKKKAADREDLYALLGLQHVRWMATDKQLKDAYRKMALKHHPDKGGTGMSDGEKTRMEEHFKKIQSAFETLSDPAKRREFDSTDDFDDSLPTEAAPADFFTVFGAAFKRQSRWSVNKPVPDLGGEDADWQAVNRFYDFWYSFKSWREFPHPDEEDIEQAESREERRWIERYNAKLREKGKKDEQKRLRKFVDDAYRQDPRILAKKDEDRKARERRKLEKANARQREQEEAERKKREEEERIAAEQAAELAAKEAMKKQKQEEKKLLKRERARLRQICAGETSECSVARVLLEESDVEKLTGSLSREQLAALCDGLVAESLTDEARLALLQEALHGRQQEQLVAERQAAQQKAQTAEAIKNMAKMDHKKAMEAMGEWSQDELRMLDKALAKFPAGTRRRWEQVTDYVRTRPQAEVLLMVKELQGAGGARMLSQDWKANRKAKGYNRGLASEDQGTVRYDDDDGAKEPVASCSGSAAPDTSPAAAAPAPTAPEWSEEQELLLVRSLKTFGKDLPDRWDRVAAAVGKTKGQCMRHYKELREKFKAKKG